MGSENVELVLSLQAPAVNFGVDEIQPGELMSEDEGVEEILTNQELRLQVGMVLLPNDLEVDPVFSSMGKEYVSFRKRSAEGVRLWLSILPLLVILQVFKCLFSRNIFSLPLVLTLLDLTGQKLFKFRGMEGNFV
jgi:hypothetical protein